MKHTTLYNLHFMAIHKAFVQRKQDEGKSTSHVESMANLSREFLQFLEEQDVGDLKKVGQGHIDQYFKYLKRRPNQRRAGGLSTAYIEKHREAVLRLMEYAKGADTGKSGYYLPVEPKDRIPKDILTEAEVALLFDRCAPTLDGIRNKAILSLLYGCGLRKGELHRLDAGDINFARSTLRVRKSKTSRQRDVPLSSRVMHHLEEYLFEVRELLLPDNAGEPAFLLNNRGQRMALVGIQYKVRMMGRQSGIKKPLTPHRLRHAIATHLLGDFSIEEIAAFLGHRSIDSSQIYTHVRYTQTPNTYG